MTDFLLELYSEEIPAGMQARAAEELARRFTAFLDDLNIAPTSLETYVAPQRLALLANGLPTQLPDRAEEKKGPRVDAPAKAIEGFLRANGLDNTDSLTVRDDAKGAFYILEINEQGGALADALAAFLPQMIAGFTWPKSMRWGAGSLRWVRPLRSVLCCLDGEIVPFSVDGLVSGDSSFGHRFMAPDALSISHAADYLRVLEHANVLADAAIREAMIAETAARLAADKGGQLVEDSQLVRETAGLVEWPVPLIGRIDDDFMDLPDEVLTSVMRTHQKYLAVRDPATGRLAPYFITVSNIVTADNGAAIIAGNERVLRARLADARFFWDQDRRNALKSHLPELENVTFHARLGTVGDKAERMKKLAGLLASAFDTADAIAATQAAELAKADLVSGMVYEFPELQGIMGGYYAAHDGLGRAVAAAITDHYKPAGPADSIPHGAEGCIVALADKIDTLTGFWLIDEKPTGSKDPYALRRAALGVIRILLETDTSLALKPVFTAALALHDGDAADTLADDLMGFLAERLKVHLREQGISHDIVSAVFADGGDDVVDLALRAEKLAAFLATEDGGNLLAAYRRANGIIEKADAEAGSVNADLLQNDEEKNLAKAINAVRGSKTLADHDALQKYLTALATLRAPVDAFFETVMVNDDNADIRQNRLNLLHGLIAKMRRAAAFDLIE